jgi:AraC-like DNA-binding protein
MEYRPYAKLLDSALKYGYYDQAHFNREFKDFYGIAPGSIKS